MHNSSYLYYDDNKGFNIPTNIFKWLDEGVILLDFPLMGGIGETIVTIGAFYELYNV